MQEKRVFIFIKVKNMKGSNYSIINNYYIDFA